MKNDQNSGKNQQSSGSIVFFPEKKQENLSPNVPNLPNFNGKIFGSSADLSPAETSLENQNNPSLKIKQTDFPVKVTVDSQSDNSPPKSNNFIKFIKNIFGLSYVKWIIVPVILLIFILSGCVWGFSKYEQYYKKIAVEKLLPNNPNLVAEVTIDPDSQQFKLLEQNLEKFPGYEFLQKELDVYGEGKTFSQFFQDKIKKAGLDFQSDIKPVLGEKAYIVVPDAKPIGNNLKYNMLVAYDEGKKVATDLMSSSTEGSRMLASLGLDGDKGDSKVLGTEKNSEIKQLDYIIASEVNDLKKASEVMDKIKKDTSKYEYTELNFEGHAYYKIKIKDSPSLDVGKFINFQETFNAMLGSNWVVSSSESFIKDAIKRQNQNLVIGSLFSGETVPSLSDDKNFEKVNANFIQESKDNFMTLYYNINYNDIFHNDKCSNDAIGCDDITEYIKYPENIVSGIGIRFDSEGIIVKSASNQMAVEDFENRPFSESLAYKIPSQMADRWADVVVEDSNVKKLYYGFKKNNLTEKGAKEWSDALKDFRDAIGIDLERDFIDIADGNIAFIFLSKKNSNPEGVIVAEISDEQKMLESMKKVVDVIKAGLIEEYGSLANLSSNYATGPNKKGYNPSPEVLEEIKIYQQALSDVQKSQIVETETSFGKIYSYQIIFPKNESFPLPSFSINFSLEDRKLVLSSSYFAVESVLKGIKDNSVEKISSGKNFQEASRYYYPSLYQYSYANTLGIYNAVEYYVNMLWSSFSSDSACQSVDCINMQKNMDQERQKLKNVVFAAGAVYRTVKLIGASSSVDEKFVKSNAYFNIQELPKEEKDRASRIIGDFSSSLAGARQKAKEASFKSYASSLVPKMIIACDERSITAEDLNDTGSHKCIDANESFKSLVQNCGPSGKGTFSINVKGYNDCQGYNANCTEVGCTFK